MKHAILIFVTFFLTFAETRAQQKYLSVVNNTNCDIVFQVYAREAGTGCLNFLTTFSTSAPNSSGPTAIQLPQGFSWINSSAPTPGNGDHYTAFIVDYDPNTLSNCFTSTGYLVGDSNCGFNPIVSLPYCTACAQSVQITWSQTGPNDYELAVN
jgi:hypothetical protein